MLRRSKPAIFASCCASQIRKKTGMSLSRRARALRALDEDVPALDVLRLSQPRVYSDVLRPVEKLYVPESAKVGAKVFGALCSTMGPVMSVAKMLRSEWDAPPALCPRCLPGPCLQTSGSVGRIIRARTYAIRWLPC